MSRQSDTEGAKATIGNIKTKWDVIVVGGGITGAGIFREAARQGLSVLLLEQKDFAWGSSSRSSKMVHGGLRYLIQGNLPLSLASVRERQRLMAEAPGLVDPLGFAMPVFKSHGTSKHLIRIALTVYSLMARQRQHECLSPSQMKDLIPLLRVDGLDAGFCFKDAQTDDARLVLRLIMEGCAQGGIALNYTKVSKLERNQQGAIAGIVAEDVENGESADLSTGVVINATGAWAENLHPSPVKDFRIRPLRGSHLVFPEKFISFDRVLSFFHPRDKRPVFLYPWEGRLMVGTTDVDHADPLDSEPRISLDEVQYLMEAVDYILPGLQLSERDCISSFAGVRPVLSSGGKAASKESRDHVVWENKGLITVTGGKLTTFRLIANDALKVVKHLLPNLSLSDKSPIFNKPLNSEAVKQSSKDISAQAWQRLFGRYGNRVEAVMNALGKNGCSAVPDTSSLWCELAYASANESVRHLSDLLLRRVRIGNLLPEGAKAHFDKIEEICKPRLSWNDEKWEKEKQVYFDEWQKHYAPPF